MGNISVQRWLGLIHVLVLFGPVMAPVQFDSDDPCGVRTVPLLTYVTAVINDVIIKSRLSLTVHITCDYWLMLSGHLMLAVCVGLTLSSSDSISILLQHESLHYLSRPLFTGVSLRTSITCIHQLRKPFSLWFKDWHILIQPSVTYCLRCWKQNAENNVLLILFV